MEMQIYFLLAEFRSNLSKLDQHKWYLDLARGEKIVVSKNKGVCVKLEE